MLQIRSQGPSDQQPRKNSLVRDALTTRHYRCPEGKLQQPDATRYGFVFILVPLKRHRLGIRSRPVAFPLDCRNPTTDEKMTLNIHGHNGARLFVRRLSNPKANALPSTGTDQMASDFSHFPSLDYSVSENLDAVVRNFGQRHHLDYSPH
jgi:hypothetical protein